jgi:FlaG/FlaF family flagellin (archaellin)
MHKMKLLTWNNMKVFYIFVVLIILGYSGVLAQDASNIRYQGVARNPDGSLIINQGIALRVSYLINPVTGSNLYQEKFEVTTNSLGYFELALGQGSPLFGAYNQIDWSLGTYFIKTEIDPNGGTDFTNLGLIQLGTVPKAYYAKKAGAGFEGSFYELTNAPLGDNKGDMLYWNGNQWINLPCGQPGQVLMLNDSIPQWDSLRETPVLNTNPITAVANGTTVAGGQVSCKYSTVIQKGVCWSENANPTIGDFKTEVGGGTGTFSSMVSGLQQNTQYYYTAYATNENGTGYGPIMKLLPTVSIDSIGTISFTTAVAFGNVLDQGSITVTARGFCYSTNPNPTLANSKILCSSGLGAYSGTLTGLASFTTYYVRAYAQNPNGTTYGDQLVFTTLEFVPPTLTSDSVYNVNYSTIAAFGTIINQGTVAFTQRGFCVGSAVNPNTSNTKIVVSGTNIGSYSSNVGGLSSGTTYHIRAYVINAVGTFYGNDLSFTTLAKPNISTLEVTSYTNNSAVFSGIVNSEGGIPVIERGICYGTSNNPVISGTHVALGNGAGAFSSEVTGLLGFYYIRAYATTALGTFYGNQVNYSTPYSSSFVKLHTVNGIAPVQKTVTYYVKNLVPGEPWKYWILQNLGANHQATSVDDATEESAGWYWQFGKKQGYKHTGSQRTPSTTWPSVSIPTDWGFSQDPCRLELGGTWRVPTKTEWTNVMNASAWTNWNGPWNSILKLHAAGALASSSGNLSNRGVIGDYWSSTHFGSTDKLTFNVNTVSVTSSSQASGYPVRCVK